MMRGASNKTVLDFKPRNEHKHYGNIWVKDYQKHNSEKLIKCCHVEINMEKEQQKTSEKSWSVSTQEVNEEHTLKKNHTWKHQINMSIWYMSQYL